MDKQQLREYLDELNQAVEQLDTVEVDKRRLVDLIEEIEAELDEPMLAAESSSFNDQVDEMITVFEQDHPSVAGILRNVLLTLSSMGV
ncbi:MAG: DUF4404 family protein [Spongiibacteraceae bacterium]